MQGLKQIPIVGVTLVLAMLQPLWTAHPDPEAQERELKDAPPEIQAFVRDVLHERLLSGDIPDLAITGGKQARRFAVRADMPQAGLKLTVAALPRIPDVVVELISLVDASATAERTRTRMSFITIDEPVVETERATVWLGADYVAAPAPGVIKMCCCASEGHFTKRDGRWVFVKWGSFRCV
jgi:hypothetical protein